MILAKMMAYTCTSIVVVMSAAGMATPVLLGGFLGYGIGNLYGMSALATTGMAYAGGTVGVAFLFLLYRTIAMLTGEIDDEA